MIISIERFNVLFLLWSSLEHKVENIQKGHSSWTFEVCVLAHIALRMFIMRVLASEFHFLANRNAGLHSHSINILASQLHKNRETCCTAECPNCLFPILWSGAQVDLIQRRS